MSFVDNNLNSNIQQLFDSNGRISVNWNNRTLYDYSEGGNQSISWHNRIAYDFSGNETINWGTQTLFDTTKAQCIVWKNRSLYDSASLSCLNWGSRSLNGDWILSGIGSISSSLSKLIYSSSLSSTSSIIFPLFNTSTSSLLEAQAGDGILVDTSNNIMIGVDQYYRPFLKDPGSDSTIGFDPSDSPYIIGETNYGVFKIIGNPGTSSEASVAFIPNGISNGDSRYWVIGTNTGTDNGNGNFDFWNGSNNVVAKLNSNGNFNISGYLVDPNTSESIDFNNRYLSDQFSNAIVEWSTFNFDQSACGFAFAPIVSGSGLFSVFSTGSAIIPCVDTNACRLSNSDGTLSVDWNNRLLFNVNGNYPNIDWGNEGYVQILSDLNIIGNITDSNNITAIDISSRILKDGNGSPVLNFQANNGSDTYTPLLLNGNFQGIVVNGTIIVQNGGINASTASLGITTVESISGNGSGLTNLTLPDWSVVTETYYASYGEKIQADTRPSGSYVIFAPASPTIGNGFTVSDATSNWGSNGIVIDGNGNNINGTGSEYISNVTNGKLEVVYINPTWGYSVK